MGVEDVEAIDWCWLNGEILPLRDARVSVDDRGFIFADGVYEGIRIYDGVPFALDRHLRRLENSRGALELSIPLNDEQLANEIDRLIAHGNVRDAFLYLQLTRGVAPRNAVFPTDAQPTLMFWTRKPPPLVPIDVQGGAKLISVPDDRWRRCWIKAIGLTASVQARNAAHRAGAEEAIFVDENGIVAEGTSSNVFVVIDGKLVTHPVGPRVLPGVTRDVVIEVARELDIETIERPIHIDEAKSAQEVFITSTTRHVMWIRTWDEKALGQSPGNITRQLSHAFDRYVAQYIAATCADRRTNRRPVARHFGCR
jgi:D-alanine transaminase